MPLPSLKKKSEFHRKREEETKKKQDWRKKLLGFSFKYGLIAFALGVVALIIVFAWFSRGLPDPNKIMDRNIAQSTKIFDSKAETVLYEIHGEEKRTLVKLEDIPEYVKWATISAEDENFYSHGGFDMRAIARTIITNITRGQKAGASTITQQFVKNAILTSEKKYSRKIKELILSYQLEKKFEKDEILQLYLNEIPYGSTAYGIASASQTFFNKDVRDLTLAESAVLAGLPKAPTYYSPYGNNREDLINRQQYILGLMEGNGYITKEEEEEAKAQELSFTIKREAITAPHFIMYVRGQLAEMFGEKVVEQGGLKVTTTLDLEKQRIAEEAVVNGVEKRSERYGFSNAALIALEPNSGKILAMVGSKDYFDESIDGNVNVTTRLRQPGSSIKPMVYAAAFNKGYPTETVLFDVNTTFKTDAANYEPKNYDLRQRGPVTMRKALQGSLNIPAVKAMYLVGVDNVINFLEMMGYSSFEDRSRFGLALVLGGGEVRLLEHAASFAVFPSQGRYYEPAAILKVEDSTGKVLYEHEDKSRKAIDKNIANMMNNVLSDNGARSYVFGPSSYLALSGRPAAAKTGTTNDYRDAWTMGYTPQLVAGVWAGNNDNSEMGSGAAGGEIAAPIWNEFMTRALEGEEVMQFESYTPNKGNKPILSGAFSNETTVKVDTFSGKIATEFTPESAIEEKTFKELHTILHYVNKDNPLGDYRSGNRDPQYANWESALQGWIQAQKDSDDPEVAEKFDFINEAPPTEIDDVHTEENKPTIFLTSPQNNQTIESPILTSAVSASAARGINRVEYFLDDKMIQSVVTYPYMLNYPISSLFSNGYHTLKVVAYDDVDNSNQVSVDINILTERMPPSVAWVFPVNGTNYNTTQFPVFTAVKLTDVLAIKKVNFYARPQGGSYALYGSDIAPTSDTVSVPWSSITTPGIYELKADIETKDGSVLTSGTISVTVN